MRILIAGGTGFVGRSLIPRLLQQHQVWVLGRDKLMVEALFGQTVIAFGWDELDLLDPNQIDCVINLAGKNIGDARWSDVVKSDIIRSRVASTEKIIKWCANATHPPHLYQASAIGVYGLPSVSSQPLPPFTEKAAIDFDIYPDFCSNVARRWEKATQVVGVPVTIMRFGVILKRGEGALKKMTPSFYVGLGSVLGSGLQVFSWVHIDDVVAAILFLLVHPDVTGPINVVAPDKVTQGQFAKALAASMKRPLFLTMPSSMIKILFGQMGEELLLSGQFVYPERLLALGFQFAHPEIDEALQQEFNSR
jgi:uncharacterized protein (TIGR01777 family)